jgi:tRNA pseudouridine65 synthase
MKLYPLHRLDRATTGVLVFAKSAEVARQMANGPEPRKIYFAVVRGYLDGPAFTVDRPLADEKGTARDCQSHVEPLAQVELPVAIGRYETARYTLVALQPLTGRRHQLRRHLAGLSHPILGDKMYGDRAHNRHWEQTDPKTRLFLQATLFGFVHPSTGEWTVLETRWDGPWHRWFDRFGITPFLGHFRKMDVRKGIG